jgi:hypothetical protein
MKRAGAAARHEIMMEAAFSPSSYRLQTLTPLRSPAPSN